MERIKSFFGYCREYGIRCSVVLLFSNLFPCSRNNLKWRKKIEEKKRKIILDYLNNNYYVEIEGTASLGDEKNPYRYCIWTAWLQGEEKAPEVIRLTIESMRRHSNGHPVIVISNDNIEQYIQLPSVIKRKYLSGIIGHAHYADIIRMMILSKYGGIWLDATMFLHEPIENRAFTSLFYSIGFDSDLETNEKFVSKHKWIVRIIGGCENSQFLSIISAMLVSYWEEHNIPIDYFVFDYIIEVLYQRNDSFRSIVDNLKKQKKFTYELSLIINEPYNEEIMNDMLSNDYVYTLSYRKEYKKITAEGLKTNYAHLCNQYLGKRCGWENNLEL